MLYSGTHPTHNCWTWTAFLLDVDERTSSLDRTSNSTSSSTLSSHPASSRSYTTFPIGGYTCYFAGRLFFALQRPSEPWCRCKSDGDSRGAAGGGVEVHLYRVVYGPAAPWTAPLYSRPTSAAATRIRHDLQGGARTSTASLPQQQARRCEHAFLSR